MISSVNSQEFADTNLLHTHNEKECLNEFCSEEHSPTESNDNFGCNTDGNGYSCSFPELDVDLDSLSKEERGRLLCDPEYITPKQLSIEYGLNEDEEYGGQRTPYNPTTIKVALFVDDTAIEYYNNSIKSPIIPYTWGNCSEWAENIVDCGTVYLNMYYGINFETQYCAAWDSPNVNNYATLLGNFTNGYNAQDYGCDMVVVLTCHMSSSGGLARTIGRSFIMRVNSGANLAGLFQHEASHLYKCTDHYGSFPTSPDCIMSERCNLNYTEYCIDCHNWIMLNQYRFDLKGYANTVYKTEKTGTAQIYFEYKITEDFADKQHAELYPGGYGKKAAIYVDMRNFNNPGASLSGYVYYRGYTSSYSPSHILIFASNDNCNWTTIHDMGFYTGGSGGETTINCGYVSNFRYLSIVIYNNNYNSASVYLDTVYIF